MMGSSSSRLIYSPSNTLEFLTITDGSIQEKTGPLTWWCPVSLGTNKPLILWFFITDSHSSEQLSQNFNINCFFFLIPSKSLLSQKISQLPSPLRKIRSIGKILPLSFLGFPYFPIPTLSTEGFILASFCLTFLFSLGSCW